MCARFAHTLLAWRFEVGEGTRGRREVRVVKVVHHAAPKCLKGVEHCLVGRVWISGELECGGTW